MENILGIFFIIFPIIFVLSVILLSLASVAFSVWMLIDCLQRDESEFKDKTLWTVLLAVGLLAGYSLILSVVYYFVVKKKLDN
jgi:hypothetical protein